MDVVIFIDNDEVIEDPNYLGGCLRVFKPEMGWKVSDRERWILY